MNTLLPLVILTSRLLLTDTVFVHDPVMAYEKGTYYLLSTGRHVQWMTSSNRKTWTLHPQGALPQIPFWTQDSVPGFRNQIWAPDIIQWHHKWWMTYACSSFGKNTSAIGLLSADSLAGNQWEDQGCIIASHKGNPYNAIDPNVIIDTQDVPWLVFGSFWDGIQLVQLDSTLHLQKGNIPRTIARRYPRSSKDVKRSDQAGTNAIEAPFIFKHAGWYYLFVSWDYCCRGLNSTYRIAVGRSRDIQGPYRDKTGRKMLEGGGTLVMEGDKKEFEAVGHCSVYHLNGKDLLICHGYCIRLGGMPILLQRAIKWQSDGWFDLK